MSDHHNKLAYNLGLIAAFVLFISLPISLIYLVKFLWTEMKSMNSDISIAIITAGTTILVSTLTVMIGRHFERRRDIEAHFRATKIQTYDDFLKELFNSFNGLQEKDMVQVLQQWQQKLVLLAGPDVLTSYFSWKSSLKAQPQTAASVFKLDEFFRALRSDVGQSNKGIEKGAFSHLILRHAEVLLAAAKGNPNITLDEVAAIEKTMGLEE